MKTPKVDHTDHRAIPSMIEFLYREGSPRVKWSSPSLCCSKCGYVFSHSRLHWPDCENFGPYTEQVIENHKCKPDDIRRFQDLSRENEESAKELLQDTIDRSRKKGFSRGVETPGEGSGFRAGWTN